MKWLKRTLILLTAACLTAGTGVLLAACNDDDGDEPPAHTQHVDADHDGKCDECNTDMPSETPNKVTYTVTVTCADSPAILATVKVGLKKGDTVVEQKSLSDGVATFSLDADTYTVVLTGALDEYEYTSATLTASSPSATIAITKKAEIVDPDAGKVEYTVTFTKDGTGVANVVFQICGGPSSACFDGTTGADGSYTFKLLPGDYEIHVLAGTPAGYLPSIAAVYSVGTNSTSATVEFVQALTFKLHLVYAEITYDQWGWEHLVVGDPVEGATVEAHKQWYDDDYVLHVDEEATASGITDENGDVELVVPKGQYSSVIDCEGYTPQYTPYLSEDALELTINMIKSGTVRNFPIYISEGTTTVSFEAGKGNTGVYYAFTPEVGKSGYYEITSSDRNGTEVSVERYAGTHGNVNPHIEQSASASTEEFNLRFLITSAECAEGNYNMWVFKFIALTDSAYSFKVTIAWKEAYIEPTTKTEQPDAHPDDSAVVQPADSKWTWLDPTSTIVKGSDGKYHVGTESGPVVYAALGSDKTPQGLDASFGYALVGGLGASFSTGEPDADNVITYYDLVPFFNAYIGVADDNGGYCVLTEELSKALQAYARLNPIAASLDWESNSELLYTFACGYFKSAYETLGGSGTEDAPFTLGAPGDYKVALKANTTYYFASKSVGTIIFDVDDVTLTYDGETYTKGQPVSLVGERITFTVTASADVDFIFTFADALGTEGNPIAWKVGDNTVTVSEDALWDGVWCSIKVDTTGVYSFTTTEAEAFVSMPDGMIDGLEGAGSFELELVGGRTYVFCCGVTGSSPKNYSVTIATASPCTPTGTGEDAEHAKQLTDDGWYRVETDSIGTGSYFALNARTTGTWKITLYNPAGSIINYGKDPDGEGATSVLGDDEVSLTITITVGDLDMGSVYYFYMGAAEEGATVYFFHFAKQESSAPGGGDEPTLQGSGSEFDPYIVTNIVGELKAHVGGMFDEDGTIFFSYTATETATYTFSASSNAWISITFLNGDIPSTLKDITPDEGLTGTITLTQGITYTISLADWNETGDCDVSLTIAKASSQTGGTIIPLPAI